MTIAPLVTLSLKNKSERIVQRLYIAHDSTTMRKTNHSCVPSTALRVNDMVDQILNAMSDELTSCVISDIDVNASTHFPRFGLKTSTSPGGSCEQL